MLPGGIPLVSINICAPLGVQMLVPRRGLEPPPSEEDQHLKLARLPIPPPGPCE